MKDKKTEKKVDTKDSTLKKVDKLKNELKIMEDKYLHSAADLENYKKFSTKEYANLFNSTKKTIFLGLLDVVDNFDRAMLHTENKESSFYKGMELIYRSFLKYLDGYGVRPFDSIGKIFDHSLNDAVQVVIDDDKEGNTIIGEQLKGYTYNNEVLRHSKVIITKKSKKEEK